MGKLGLGEGRRVAAARGRAGPGARAHPAPPLREGPPGRNDRPSPLPASLAPPSGLLCEHPPPMVLLQTSPCDQFECQNGAQCIEVQQEPTCRCPPGFAGPRCEKLITVNFVGKDSYVELASAKVRPQANISLQVRPPRPGRAPHAPSSDRPEQLGCPPPQRRQGQPSACGLWPSSVQGAPETAPDQPPG